MLKRLLGPLVLLLVLAACTRSGPPAIAVTVSPADGAENVPITAIVTADFNVAMNESTVNGAFTLSSSAGEVAGVLAYDASLRRATFTPSAPLTYDTEYTAAVAGTVRSAAGGRIPIPTTGEYAWSFTTESDPGVAPEVTAVAVTPPTAELEIGETQQFVATVTAVGGASTAVTWSSSDEDVATVDEDGLVTAVAEGVATITATSDFNDTISGSATVTVSEAPPVPSVTSVTVTPSSAGLLVGETEQLAVDVVAVNGASTAVTWSSSDEDVATVDADGLVTAVAPGAATITATSVATPSVSGSATVSVSAVPAVLSVTIVDPGDVYITEVVTLQADVVVAGGLSEDVTWESSDEAVATIDENTGELIALSEGPTTITATSVDDPSMSDEFEVVVLGPTVTEVTVSPESVTLNVDEDEQFTADVTAFGGAAEDLTWESSDEDVATVDADGLVTAVAPGTATITATSVASPTVSGTATVNVAGVTDVVIDPGTADLLVGGTQQLTADVTPLHDADESVTWTSDDEDVATVDEDGLVTAVAGGTATITATSVASPTVSGTATINVQTVTAVEVDPATLNLAVDGTDTLTADVTATGGADDSVTWSSSDDLIATVDADGVVTAVAVGEAIITATSVFDTAFSGTATVTVLDVPVADDYDTEVGYLEGTLVEIDAPEVTSGGLAPFSFEVTGGALPDGVELEEDGSISFTPVVTGTNTTYTGTVTVTDALGQTDEADFSIVVVGVLVTVGATDVHPDLVAGTEIDPIALVVSGGLAPFTYEVVACDPLDAAFAAFDCTDVFGDALPPGLDIDEDGNLVGTPTLAEFYRSYVVLTDAIGQESAPLQFEIDVDMDLFWSQSSYQYPLGFTTDTAYHDAANYAVLIPGTGFAMTLFGLDEPAWTVIGNTGTLAFTWELLTGGGLSNARWHIGGTTGTIFRNMNSLVNNTAANHNSNRTYRITVTDGATGRTASFDLSFEVVPVIDWTPIWVPVP